MYVGFIQAENKVSVCAGVHVYNILMTQNWQKKTHLIPIKTIYIVIFTITVQKLYCFQQILQGVGRIKPVR